MKLFFIVKDLLPILFRMNLT